MKEDLLKKLPFIVFGENKWRLKTGTNEHGELIITYDAHGQTVAEARRTIHNIVNLSRIPIQLGIIHGYHNGTAIKDMLQTENFYGKVACMFCPADNAGKTIMRII